MLDRIVGVAMGRVGLNLDDLERLTPHELNAICDAWQDGQTARQKERWEQTRWIAYYSFAGFSSKRIKPQDILRFSWDDAKSMQPAKHSTREAFERERKLIYDLKNKHILKDV